MRTTVLVAMACFMAAATAADTSVPAESKPAAHAIAAAKLIIGDVRQNQAFYEQMFGMKEVAHYSADGVYDEPIMGFGSGARLALFSPAAEAALQKSAFPVVLIYTPEFDAVVKRVEDAKHPVRVLPAAQSGTFRIAIARDPSGNAVEILAREGGGYGVGGSKLIVADRQRAEEFFVQVFGVKPIERYKTAAYDEVLLGFEGAFLALFQPLAEAPLPKSRFPVVAIYTSQFDDVLARVEKLGLGYREVKTSGGGRIIVASDPSGNGVEIIAR